MMTLRKLSNAQQAANYFEHDDYYVDGSQVAPSSWWGKGASRLGLEGQVDRRAFAELLEGRLPNGVVLEKGGTGVHHPGTDLTFSAPKSVSLAALVGGDERILAAHEHAVTVALGYLEETTPRARTRKDGIVRVEATDNLVVARFNHDSSRAADPQLHTHAVVLNVTRRRDREWKALTNREIFRAGKAASAIYWAELARSLRDLGYRIERTQADGRFEISGISKDVLAAFSQRRAQIVAHLERRGLEGPKAADVAARATRDRKQEVDRDLLRAEWQNRAAELGLDLHQLRGRPVRISRGARRSEAERALDHAIDHVTERKVVAAERELIQVALGFGAGTVGLLEIQRAIDRRIEHGDLVPATSSTQRDPFTRHLTTDFARATEQHLLDLLSNGRDIQPIATTSTIERAIATIEAESPLPLTAGQQQAIELVLSASERIVGIQGYAGTGKTTGALLHIARVAAAEGFEVRGFAPSASAAEVLGLETGIESMTIARLLRSPETRTYRPQLWIIDEASMIGNETARGLLDAARRVDARVVLVGDRDQLPSIEAGRAFRLLMDHGMRVATLDDIVRQRNPHIRQAVEKTIGREHEAALELLGRRVVAIPKREDRLRAIARTFVDLDERERRSTLVVTATNADRRRLNELIRDGLRAGAELGSAEIAGSILVGRDFTRAQAKDAAEYQVGDVVRFGRSYRRLRVEAGEYFAVDSVDVARGTIQLVDTDNRRITWRPKSAWKVEVYRSEDRTLSVGDIVRWTRNDAELGRINAGVGEVVAIDRAQRTADILSSGKIHVLDLDRQMHWEHAYAGTVHLAQGRTGDRVLLHLDSKQPHLLGHESWYVGISRARSDLQIFTDDPARLPLQIQRSLEQESALEVSRKPASREVARERGSFEFGY